MRLYNVKHHKAEVLSQVALAIFNLVVSPILATLFISPSCFYYQIFTSPPEITSSYSFSKCISLNTDLSCGALVFQGSYTTSYKPPFEYSYQCSASLITYYAEVYLYIFMAATFGIPLLKFGSIWAFESLKEEGKGMWRVNQFIYKYMAKRVSPLWKAALVLDEGNCSSNEKNHKADYESEGSVENVGATTSSVNSVQTEITLPRTESVYECNHEITNLFDRDSIVVKNVSRMSIIITFGAIFPPIAIAGCVCILSHILLLLLLIGRFCCIQLERMENSRSEMDRIRYITSSNDLEDKGQYSKALTMAQSTFNRAKFQLDLLNQLSKGCGRNLSRAVWIMFPLASFYYSIFVLDTLGDEIGWRSALPATFIMAFWSIISFSLFVIARAVMRRYCAGIYNSKFISKSVSVGVMNTNEPFEASNHANIPQNPIHETTFSL